MISRSVFKTLLVFRLATLAMLELKVVVNSSASLCFHGDIDDVFVDVKVELCCQWRNITLSLLMLVSLLIFLSVFCSC